MIRKFGKLAGVYIDKKYNRSNDPTLCGVYLTGGNRRDREDLIQKREKRKEYKVIGMDMKWSLEQRCTK